MHNLLKCILCSKEYYAQLCDVKKGRSKYCSRKCLGKSGEFWSKATWEEKIKRLKYYFDKHVIKKEGCWEWSGSLLCGRGQLSFNKKIIQAHRASWMIHFGEIPKGILVCHTCDNIICTNPEHLFLGTPSQNTIDMVIKGRSPRSKLTIEDVKEIKELLKAGTKQILIAKKFNVHPVTINDIKLGYTWKCIKSASL